MNKYIPVTDLNEVAKLKRKGECYFNSRTKEGIIKVGGNFIYINYEYYRLNPDYKEPEKDERYIKLCPKCKEIAEELIKEKCRNYFTPKEPEKNCDNCKTGPRNDCYDCVSKNKWKPKEPEKECKYCNKQEATLLALYKPEKSCDEDCVWFPAHKACADCSYLPKSEKLEKSCGNCASAFSKTLVYCNDCRSDNLKHWKPKDPPALPESIRRIIFGCFGPYENDVKILMEAMWQEIIKELRK